MYCILKRRGEPDGHQAAFVTALQRCAVVDRRSVSRVEAELLGHGVAFCCMSFSYRTLCGAPAVPPVHKGLSCCRGGAACAVWALASLQPQLLLWSSSQRCMGGSCPAGRGSEPGNPRVVTVMKQVSQAVESLQYSVTR